MLGLFFGAPWRQEPKTRSAVWGRRVALGVWVVIALALVVVTLLLVLD